MYPLFLFLVMINKEQTHHPPDAGYGVVVAEPLTKDLLFTVI
jgi:hypothetical protein